jgi:hypothetical protein
LLGVFAAVMAYATLVWQPSAPPEVETVSPVEAAVAVPMVDAKILAGALDTSREQRLLLEVEPLRHLLALAIDVGPTVAAALGMPEQPLAVSELRENPDALRGRWLFCEGVLEELAGPREGHPIRGFSIYDATIGMPDGNRVMGTFSMPPDSALERGSWVRLEGFFLKLRDTTWPQANSQVPLLVGREIHRDYDDWGPVPAARRVDPRQGRGFELPAGGQDVAHDRGGPDRSAVAPRRLRSRHEQPAHARRLAPHLCAQRARHSRRTRREQGPLAARRCASSAR